MPQGQVREEMSTPQALHLGEETDPRTPGRGWAMAGPGNHFHPNKTFPNPFFREHRIV